MSAARRNVFRVITKVQQRGQRLIGDYPNVTSSSAIAARRPTARYKFFAAKSSDTIATIATFYSNLRAINKHLKRKRRQPKFFSTWLGRRMIARFIPSPRQ